MIRKEKYTPKPEQQERIVERKCDLCGRVAPIAWDNGNWSENRSAFHRTNVEISTGSSYPEGGYEEATVFDICVECFTDKLIPWFKSQGAEPHTKETDW